MTADQKISTSKKPQISLLPLLVTLGGIILYAATLQHWVTLSSLPTISKITGWDWHPAPLPWRQTPVTPLLLLLTLPIRIFPLAWEPVLLNIFAAVCAALTLGLLAASVQLLPHDRTREQRQREGGGFALLSMPGSFLPPLFAALMMALQLTFWRHAIAATGEMLDLLVFASLIYCLLKFRISQNDNWLAAFAFLYGIGATNNWALIGFFPFFLVAMIWIKGITFFNLRFLARIMGCGLVGLSLYLLIPAMGSLSSERANFWTLLHMELGTQSFELRVVPRWLVLVMAVPTLLPLIFAGIKWPSFEGELSAAGYALTRLMFRLLHVFFLFLAWLMFTDLKFSPALKLADVPVPFLTFYYMAALCIGYYSGYVLLVFGKDALQSDSREMVAKIFNQVVAVGLWIFAIFATGWLFAKSFPHIRAANSDAQSVYADEIIHDLPSKPVILLCDDPVRMNLLEAAYVRAGKRNPNFMIETGSLAHREYVTYLVSRYPEIAKITPDPSKHFPPVLSADGLERYLVFLSRKYPLYYAHPSFGYYFEVFYLKPHGLAYEMQPYTSDTIQEQPPTPQDIAENEAVWTKLQKSTLAGLPALAKLDPDNASMADDYSVALEEWAVRLQKAGRLKEANADFAEALKLYPQNFVAAVNKMYNERLQKNDHRPLDTSEQLYRALVIYRGLVPILKYNGLPDEPDFNLQFGQLMAQGGDFRQAAMLFERRLELLPGDPSAELDLAKTFVDWRKPDKALALVAKLRSNPAADKWEVSRVEALSYLGKQDYPTAERLLQAALREKPADMNRITTVAEFYRVTAYDALRQANLALRQTNRMLNKTLTAEAGRRFTNALAYYDQQVQLLTQSSHNSASPNAYGVPAVLLKKAEVQMMIKSFKPGIETLTKVIDLEPKNVTAFLNRAIAELQINNFNAAKDDYKSMRRLIPPGQRYLVDYGLADVAAHEKDTPEEIRCLERYLQTAPEELPEYASVKQRLRKLEIH